MAAALNTLPVERIVSYIERCQTPDGGFFFARIPPGGAKDTYHAVAALRLLGRNPSRSQDVRSWLKAGIANSFSPHPNTVFYLTKTALALRMNSKALHKWAAGLYAFENPQGGFGAWQNVDVETTSELESTYFAIAALLDLGQEIRSDKVSEFVLGFHNPDGGFGGNGRSTLASTFYAVALLTRLAVDPSCLSDTADWLSEREDGRFVPYLEHLYWLASGLKALGRPLSNHEWAASFVLACQHPNGGFTRAPVGVGIATLEYTHYALEVLQIAGRLPGFLRLY